MFKLPETITEEELIAVLNSTRSFERIKIYSCCCWCSCFAEWDSRSRADKIRSGMKKAQNLGKKVGGFRGGRKPIKINKENKDWDGLA